MKKNSSSIDEIKEFLGNNNVSFIDLDDSFGFKCQQCGRCCMNREDIIINPFDVYNAAKYLNITPSDFVKKYTKIDLGGQSKIPIVLLRTTENGFCPLLEYDIKDGGKFKCIINPAKPGACANHPIGIIRECDVSTNESQIKCIKVEQCPNSVSDEMHKVRDWIKPYIDNGEEIKNAHRLQTLASNYFNPRHFWLLVVTLSKLAKSSSSAPEELYLTIKKTFEAYIDTIVDLSYCNYDTSKPFLEQAKDNEEELDSFYNNTREMYESLKIVIEGMTNKKFEDLINDFENAKEEE